MKNDDGTMNWYHAYHTLARELDKTKAQLHQARREGWEQCQRDAIKLLGRKYAANDIASMAYEEKTTT